MATGKTIIVGTETDAFGDSDFAVYRYNSDWTLDTTFNGTGKVLVDIGQFDHGYSSALQTDGKILVAGTVNFDPDDPLYAFGVARLNVDGSLDTSFDSDGKVSSYFGGGARGYDVAVQADGKIVVGGYAAISSNRDFAVVRYNSDGSKDTSFDFDGIVTTNVGNDYGYAVAIQADGKILMGGSTALLRYNSNGSLDTTFNGTGILKNIAVNGPKTIIAQTDGKILVYSTVGPIRLNSDGSRDTSFSSASPLTLVGGSGDDTLVGDIGNDWLNGGGGNDNLEGLAGGDRLEGAAGDDWLKGGDGDDQLTGGTGYDVLEGGNGNDTYVLAAGDEGDVLIDTGGIDTIQSAFSYTLVGTDFENLFLTGTNLVGTGNGKDNWMKGNGGASLSGGAGNDKLENAKTLLGGDGNDILIGGYGSLLEGGAGDDTLTGNSGTFKGGAGKDSLRDDSNGGGVADYSDKTQNVVVTLVRNTTTLVYVGGVQEDSILYFERVTGGSGNDKLKGDEASNILRGGAGNDQLWTGSAGTDDKLYGEDGDDILYAESLSRSFLDGGAGNDTVDFSSRTDAGSLTWINDTYFSAYGSYISNVEIIIGGSAGDTFAGNALVNTLNGGAGDDVLSGLGGNDILQGGTGNDILKGGLGKDSMTGGTGIDTADYSDKTAAVSVALRGSRAVDVFVGGVAEDSIWNIENVFGGSGNDTLTGDGNGNLFRGGLGIDTLDGGAGIDTADFTDKTVSVALSLSGSNVRTSLVGGIAEDTVRNIENIIGGSGNDTLGGDSLANVLKGGAGNDTLTGGTGDDVLIGGLGSDFLKGGGGNDQFVFNTALGSSNVDTVDDFRVGGDLLVLDHAIFTSLTVGTMSDDAFWVGTGAHDANDRIIYNDVTGALFYDTNGSAVGGSVQFATLDPGRALTHSDFLVT